MVINEIKSKMSKRTRICFDCVFKDVTNDIEFENIEVLLNDRFVNVFSTICDASYLIPEYIYFNHFHKNKKTLRVTIGENISSELCDECFYQLEHTVLAQEKI